MWRNYLSVAVRQFLRAKLYSTLNILGLALGLATTILVMLFVLDELRYDRFLPEYDRIYRVSAGSGNVEADTAPPDVASWLKTDFTEIEHAGRLLRQQLGVRRGDMEATESVYIADPEIFAILRLPALAGDPLNVLHRPDSIVLTRRIAEKYFGSVNVIGQRLEIDRKYTLEVGAVLEDLPSNTHLNTEIFVPASASFSRLAELDAIPSGMPTKPWEAYTYLQLRPGASAATIQALLRAMLDRHMNTRGGPANRALRLSMLPVTAIHLHRSGLAAMKPPGSKGTIAAFCIIALLVAVAACINFVNLATARAGRRAIEIGVRKASGAARSDLCIQFLGESVAYVLIALVLALIGVSLLLPSLDTYLERSSIVSSWHERGVLLATIGGASLIGVLAGIYPALVLSSFKPAAVLRGGPNPRSEHRHVREALVVVQFAISIALIAATLVIHRQTLYGMNEGSRLNGRDTVLINATCTDTLKDAVRAVPGITEVACAQTVPLFAGLASGVSLPSGARAQLFYNATESGFFELYGLRPLAGRFFSRERGMDQAFATATDGVSPPDEMLVINQSAVRLLNFDSPQEAVGRTFRWRHLRGSAGQFTDEHTSQVIGVVPDFVIGSLREPIPALAFFWDPNQLQTVHVNLAQHGDTEKALAGIDEVWRRLGDSRPIQRIFLKAARERAYFEIARQSQLLGVFAAISVLLGCLGMVGLAAFTVERRTKEIGVRKAFGADRRDVLKLLGGQFLMPIFWASAIALPLVAFAMLRWLQGFAYHIPLQPWMLACGSLGALTIACAAASVQTVSATNIQPITALRYE